MTKLVVLKLEGNLQEQGLRATLEIGNEGERPYLDLIGSLPADPKLGDFLQAHWQEKYRQVEKLPQISSLPAAYRLKPKKVSYNASVREWVKECKVSAQQLRDRFQSWLRAESFREIDLRLREELSRDEVISFLIRTDEQEIQKLPWQEWDFFQRYSKAEVSFSFTRFEQAPRITPTKNKAKVKILAILGHSTDINVRADRKLLKSLPNAETLFLVEPQLHQINEQLWEQSWDIIFFAGHSETLTDKGLIYLNEEDSLTINELKFALKKAVKQGLKLVIFNSCDGLGLAQELDSLHIPRTIVMRELVPDKVAQEFLKYFLQCFARGGPFHMAVREARERMQGLEDQFPCASWLPTIFQNLGETSFTWEQILPGKGSLSNFGVLQLLL